MKFFETSKYHFFKKSTYISLRWIGIIGQLISVNFVYFFLNFEFDFLTSNLVIFFGILSNLFLIYIYKKTQLSDRSAFIFLVIDIFQLGVLLYLTGGITNPFVIFLLIPSIFSSSNLSLRTNTLLVALTAITIVFLTFYHHDLPMPIKSDLHNNHYYYYSIPTALIIALIFLNYLAMSFGTQSRLRREALSKMEEVMASEHELLSLGGQAAAAAHSLGTPLSTIKIIAHDLEKQFHDQEDVKKDIELLSSQVERCNEILKRLTLNPVEEDEFIDKDLTMRDYLSEIILSFKEISKKKFIFNFDQFSNVKKITKSIEIVYGLRNFIGNANKFSKNSIYINLKSDSEFTEITIEDDGNGYPKDVLSKIGEPYLRSNDPIDKSKTGLGLGLFIGKTLLEKNFASINCRNSKTRTGAEVIIKWNNKDLFNI
ncbi:ActS/PrrB/RegB family redox-sensitive histidine kinase [Candidatus Pelagibacter sp.]|jgi:two-component system sensor histidine kinase RegB|nr:ActS/PrrB/RegB family redox-sensitive histidine kinase [Candidatus Pelagibacter bacterium]MDA8985057.1 ActS/PrrB/RegB family redox-sensitive histidine kinase [Candidatus Pelagibacter sp.]MDA9788960.1 ActS/PrrB/RegB family redox-sensitive histidine kinase [Candidatus Pelagibacter sp.]MDB4834811.1 ActS/PrrB/RegB family redox-sensitive histidine kinase [Candidatus Pelagibacter sp.]MDC0988194.1 ActS/PrrB/RegB family redox-sensitive histidine kinase [Candidatus Pelagibacter sp.]